jgi:hypothetical protein
MSPADFLRYFAKVRLFIGQVAAGGICDWSNLKMDR